jgi:hypothetical protein
MKHQEINGNGEKEVWYAIHEVYYKDDEVNDLTVESNEISYTKEPVRVTAATAEDLKWILEEMLSSLNKPILDYLIGDEND